MTAAPSAPERDLDLVVVGDVNPDIVVTGAEPQFGQREVIVESVSLTIGGSAGIMAAAAARLGLRVALVGVVGDDVFGRFMLDELRRRDVDVRAVRVDRGRPTGATVILARPTDRAILTATGTIADLAAADIPNDLIARCRHLHVASYYLQPALWTGMADLVERARAAGVSVSVDPNWDPTERWDGGLTDLLPRIDLFMPNEAEALRISGRATVEDAARALGASGPGPVVVVKRGGDGALCVDGDGTLHKTAAFPVEPVDTTGAGDAFDAGFVATWLGKRPIADCLAFAAVCGALSTRSMGGTAGQATRAEAEAALAGWSRG